MPVAIVTGSGGLIGSEAVALLRRGRAIDVVGLDNDMRARVLRRRGVDARTTTERLRRRATTRFTPLDLDIRDRDGVERVFAEHARADRARRPHRGAAVARLGGARPADRLRRQRGRHAEPARGGRAPHARRAVHLHLDEQGLRRPAELPAAGRARDAAGSCPTDHAGTAASTTMSIDRCTHSLFGASKVAADVLVQEYGRYFEMPTVCFRGGCLTGPQHSGAELHGFLAYLMRCTVERRPVHDLRLQGQAGPRQHPRHDVVRAFEAFHEHPRPPRSTTSAAAATATARCSRRSSCASRSPVASSTTRCPTQARIGDHHWWISDLDAFSATTRSGADATGSRTSCARSTTTTSSAGRPVPPPCR